MPAHHTPTLTASRSSSRYRLYLIKTIPHREGRSLQRILPRYVRHVEKYPHTLLPRFMGAHRLILPGVGKVHFVVTSNVFSTDRAIHERYDLKGSTYGRTSDKLLREGIDAVRKDLDLKRQFRVGERRSAAFLEQIQHDIDFLREMELMDYSLLCGVHYPRRDDGSASLPPQSPPAPDGATPLSPPAVIREESSDHRPAPASPDVVAEAARASRASYAANYAAAPAPAPSRSGSGNGGSGGDGSAGLLRSGSPVLRPSTAGAMPPLRPLGEKGIALPKPPWVDHWDGAIDGDV